MNSLPCPHGMGKAASCIECMAEGPVAAPQEKLHASFWMNAARYDGQCARCEGPIVEGEPIGKTYLGWCCALCCEPKEGI